MGSRDVPTSVHTAPSKPTQNIRTPKFLLVVPRAGLHPWICAHTGGPRHPSAHCRPQGWLLEGGGWSVGVGGQEGTW